MGNERNHPHNRIDRLGTDLFWRVGYPDTRITGARPRWITCQSKPVSKRKL